jgi:hypothetical protein
MDFHMRVYPQRQWSRKLCFFVEKMPSLKRFKLVSEFGVHAQPMRETSDSGAIDARLGQEVRALLRSASFLTLRHPGLNLMIWPADTGPTYEEDDHVIHAYVDLLENKRKRNNGKNIEVEKYERPGDETRKVFKVCH